MLHQVFMCYGEFDLGRFSLGVSGSGGFCAVSFIVISRLLQES